MTNYITKIVGKELFTVVNIKDSADALLAAVATT